jgi:hypothetical protein
MDVLSDLSPRPGPESALYLCSGFFFFGDRLAGLAAAASSWNEARIIS